MKRIIKPHKLVVVSLVYWVLLTYMVAALLFWFTELEKQNRNITQIKLSEINNDSPSFYSESIKIEELKNRKTAQYIGEGFTFLVLIIVGAIYVYRAARKQIKLSQQQQNFMMAITHELKTPIAIAQLNLETLLKRKLEEETQNKLINNTLQEANRLNTLCNNILFAAQLDAGAYQTNKTEINFSDLLGGCVDDFKNRFPQRKVLESLAESIYLYSESFLLQMLVNNLLENAVKYSPKESLISVLLIQKSRLAILTVSDEGVGITKSEKHKIFEKFYRTGDEHTRSTKGTGLGLYLCKKITDSCKGVISVKDNYPRGCIFTVSLPIA